MTIKARVVRLEQVHQAANNFAVVIVQKGETVEEAKARTGIGLGFKGTLVMVNRQAACSEGDDAK